MQGKKVVALFIASILLTSLISYIAFSNPDLSYTTVIQEGSMNIDASYVVFVDGSTYYIRNGRTGAIISGANLSQIVQDTIDDSDGGEIIHFQEGEYWVTHMITVDKPATLIKGSTTWIDKTSGVYGNTAKGTILYAENGDLPAIFNVTGFMSGIEDMAFQGLGQATSEVAIYGRCQDFHARHLSVNNFSTGIYLHEYPVGVGGINKWVEDCWIEYCYYGIQSSANWVWIKNNIFSGNNHSDIYVNVAGKYQYWITDNKCNGEGYTDHFFSIGGSFQYATFIGNHFRNYEYDIYRFNYDPSDICISNEIVNGVSFTGYYIYTAGGTTATNCVVSDVIISNMANASNLVFHEDGAVFDKTGGIYINDKPIENSGNATISAATFVDVTHGLAWTPTMVVVTAQSDINGDSWISNEGSTTFRINVDGSQTVSFYWRAEFEP